MEGFSMVACIYFSIQLILSELVYMMKWKKKNLFPLRAGAGIFVYAIACFAIITVFRRVPGYNPYVRMIYYVILFLMTLGLMYACFQIHFEDMLFAGICGYATQHFSYSVISMIILFADMEADYSKISTFLLMGLLPYIVTVVIIYFLLIRDMEGELHNRDFPMMVLAGVILFVTVFLSVLVSGDLFRKDSPLLTGGICKAYGAVCSGLSLYIAFILSRQNWLMRERELMESMLRTSKEQQELSRESIDIINIKCHDLKYRISKISRIQDEEEQKEYIDSVKNAVSIYDNIFQTGNDALDLILTEKNLLCDQYNIKMSSIVDGTSIQMINSTDIYALLGNLLDNAIESVKKEPNEEKRIMSLRIVKEAQGVHICVDNYCPVEPEFEAGLPKTTKQDKAYHGFGVRSIKYIVDKYQGELLMNVKDHHFQVDIMFFDL